MLLCRLAGMLSTCGSCKTRWCSAFAGHMIAALFLLELCTLCNRCFRWHVVLLRRPAGMLSTCGLCKAPSNQHCSLASRNRTGHMTCCNTQQIHNSRPGHAAREGM